MNPQVAKALRAIVAIVVLGLLLLTVVRWWREYQAAPGTGVETSSTAPAPEKEGSDAKPDEESKDTVVVLVGGLNLREKPDEDAKAIRGLNEDERLTLIKTEDEWYLVKTAEGDEGWVSSNPSYSKIVKR